MEGCGAPIRPVQEPEARAHRTPVRPLGPGKTGAVEKRATGREAAGGTAKTDLRKGRYFT